MRLPNAMHLLHAMWQFIACIGIISEKWGSRARESHPSRRKGSFLRAQLVGPKEQVF